MISAYHIYGYGYSVKDEKYCQVFIFQSISQCFKVFKFLWHMTTDTLYIAPAIRLRADLRRVFKCV